MEEHVLSQEFRQPRGQVHYLLSPGTVEEGGDGVSLKGEKSIDGGVLKFELIEHVFKEKLFYVTESRKWKW